MYGTWVNLLSQIQLGRLSAVSSLALTQRWSHRLFALFVRFRWPYWRAWRCQRIPNSRRSFLPPPERALDTNQRCHTQACVRSQHGPSRQMGLTRLPSFSRCPLCLVHFNVKGINLSYHWAANKLDWACGHQYREELELLWIAVLFFHIPVFALWTSRYRQHQKENAAWNLSTRPETKLIDPLSTPTQSAVKIPTLC